MTTDIRIDDDFVSVEGPLKVNEVRPLSIKELNFPSPIKVDQIRPRAQKSILFISQGIKLLRSGKFDESLGTALAHGKDDKLVINEGGGYKGGVQIAGKVTVDNLSAKNIQTNVLSAKKGIQTDELSAKVVTIDSLTVNKNIQTNVLSAKTSIKTDELTANEVTADALTANQNIQTNVLSAKISIKTDELTANEVTADSLTVKKFVQTGDLGADAVETKSALVKGDLTVGGKLVASGHNSVDLIKLVLQLQAQVTKLQAQMAALKK